MDAEESAGVEGQPDMTIDQLAAAAGVVVSTVRLYQNRGLLAPPHRRGRVGWYDATHLGRLRLIGQLQERGFSLAAIKELVDGMEKGDSLRAILGLGDRPSTWVVEEPRTMPLSELAAFLPQVELTPQLALRVMELGLARLADEPGQATLLQPSFLEIGSELAALGVPAEVILDEYEVLRDDAMRIAGRFTDVFRTHLWEPFVESGMPAERVTELVGALEKLGPLAEGVVVMALRHALQELAERFIHEEAPRLGVEIPQPGRRPEPA
jgi:DNA-binding transcriptional MerR regulator